MKAQGLVDHTIQVVSVLEFLIVDVSRWANMLRYLVTQFNNMLGVANQLIEDVS